MRLQAYVFLLFTLLVGLANAGPSKKEWPILLDDKKSYMIGSMYVDADHVGEELPLAKLGRGNLFNLLSTYYSLAKGNDVSAIGQLYLEKDGSRDRFFTEVSRIPDKYSGFHKVDKIVLGEIFYWGSYAAVSVEWYANNKRITRWVELVYCESSCSLSNRLLHTDASFEAFSSFMSSYLRDSKQPIRKGGDDKLSYYPAAGPNKNPIDLTYLIERYPGRIEVKNKGEDTVLFGLKDAKSDVLVVAKFLKSVWSNGDKVLEDLASDKGANAKLMVSSLYNPFWHDFDLEEMVPMYDKSGEGGKMHKWEAVYYTPLSLLQKISKWEKVSFFGFMQSDKTKYIFIRGVDKGGSRFMQFFPVFIGSSDSKITANPDNPFVRSIFMTPEFSNDISKQILN